MRYALTLSVGGLQGRRFQRQNTQSVRAGVVECEKAEWRFCSGMQAMHGAIHGWVYAKRKRLQ